MRNVKKGVKSKLIHKKKYIVQENADAGAKVWLKVVEQVRRNTRALYKGRE